MRILTFIGSAMAALCLCACSGPAGVKAFTASREAFQHLDHVTMTWTSTTRLGVFTESAEFDCAAHYYHYRYVKDLNDAGVQDGSSLSQGRPKAHQEEERLFVDGQSFGRFSGGWENPQNDDARDWAPASSSYDPADECRRMQDGADNRFVPFKRILEANAIKYLGTQTVDSSRCYEYEATYPMVVYTDKFKTTDLGGGSSFSERETVTKPAPSNVCLGTKDFLPRRTVVQEQTVTFSYAPIARVPNPRG